jgi:hypothetical protein
MSAFLQAPRPDLVRFTCGLIEARGDTMQAHLAAARRYGEDSPPAMMLRAASTSGSTIPADTWGSTLAVAATASAGFVATLARSVADQLRPFARTVPFHTPVPVEADAATASWVGERHPKPLSAGALTTVNGLAPLKAVGHCVITNEVAKFGNGEQAAAAIMRAAVTRAVDGKLLSDDAAVANTSPAGLLNGVSPVAGTGDPLEDAAALFANFTGDLASAVLIVDPGTALTWGLAGGPLIDVTTRNGGTLAGVPQFTSKFVSGAVLLDASQLVLALGDVAVGVTTEAAMQMEDAPTDPVTASVVLVSLFQHNMAGIRVERFCNWALASAGAVSHLTPPAALMAARSAAAKPPAKGKPAPGRR